MMEKLIGALAVLIIGAVFTVQPTRALKPPVKAAKQEVSAFKVETKGIFRDTEGVEVRGKKAYAKAGYHFEKSGSNGAIVIRDRDKKKVGGTWTCNCNRSGKCEISVGGNALECLPGTCSPAGSCLLIVKTGTIE